MNFCSDNVAGAAPEILDAVARANEGPAAAYGDDELSVRVAQKLADVFECQADVFFVTTGTAANALSLSVMAPPYGEIFCHPDAHIQVDECGAPELFTGGAKLTPLPSDDGKVHAGDLEAVLTAPDHGVHHVQAAALSITQASEAGTVYTPDEIRTLSTLAHDHGLSVHMDGARFANALVSLGCSPAEVTWKAGVDVLCFGASKNGALAAEAVVIFNKTLAETFAFRRKRGGHLISKMRFLAAQLDAYLEGDLWLKLARHANATAAKLAVGLKDVPGVSFMYTPQANEIFVELPENVILGLEADGFGFYRWPGDGAKAIRLVTAFNTRDEDVNAFIKSAKRHAG